MEREVNALVGMIVYCKEQLESSNYEIDICEGQEELDFEALIELVGTLLNG